VRGAGLRSAMLREKLSALLPATLRHRASLRSSHHVRVVSFVACDSPCYARKAGDFQSVENPARRIRRARVSHAPEKQVDDPL